MKRATHVVRVGVITGILLAATTFAPTVAGKTKNDSKAASKAEAVTIRVTPLFALAGNPVQAMIRVAPNSDNRLLRIMIDSEHYFQSSDVELSGTDAPITHFVPMKALPAGRYDVLVIVYGSEGERARSGQQFRLLSMMEASEDEGWMRRKR